MVAKQALATPLATFCRKPGVKLVVIQALATFRSNNGVDEENYKVPVLGIEVDGRLLIPLCAR